MQIAIIGGGFTGLAAAYELGKHGHRVTLFEKEPILGGLAHGYREKGWDWRLETSYHHLFTNDFTIMDLLAELNLIDALIIRRSVTATMWNGKVYQMDTPIHLLRFPGIPFHDRLRTGMVLGAMRVLPYMRFLEENTAEELLMRYGGQTAWRVLWKPLMEGKFSSLSPTVAASWFWARMKKRTPQLAYIFGGFRTLIDALETSIRKQGGTIVRNTEIPSIALHYKNQLPVFTILNSSFEKTLLTVPSFVTTKLVPSLPTAYAKSLLSIPHLHAQTLILETKDSILNGIYWLNITDRSFPFLAVIAHTNFMDKKHYGNHHLTYFGNYLPDGHPYLSMTREQLLKKFSPYIKRLNPDFNPQLSIIRSQLFVGPYAQPVHQLHYSRLAPKLTTPLKGLYLANLDSIFPWDRGVNYAVELGVKAAREIIATAQS